MDSLLEGERLRPSHLRALAGALLDRHSRAPSAPDAAPGPDFFRGVLDSLAVRHTLPSALRGRLEANLEKNADRLLARAGSGRILAAADELTPRDVYFGETDGEVAEGAESVRIAPDAGRAFGVAVDAALEIASLSVWLARYERADLSEVLISRYANEAEDFDLYLVLDFYESFCALTQGARAKEASDTPPPTVLLPIPSARTPLTRPIVVAMSGPVASGKSTLARSLADHLASPPWRDLRHRPDARARRPTPPADAGLLAYFDVCVFSDEVGVPKPDPRIFHIALEALAASASHTAHVGDLLRTDVAGARGVGMASIRIRAAYDDPSEQPEADLLADSHAQLREIFERALG